MAKAEAEQKDIILQATKEAMRLRSAADEDARAKRTEIQRLERRVTQKEENLDRKLESLERRERNFGNKEKDLENTSAQIEGFKAQGLKELEQISRLTTLEAKEILLSRVEDEARQDASRRLYEFELRLKEEADQRARDILIQAIQRCAADVISEMTVSVVQIPSDDMKGRIIGREGRNIRALEHATGVDVIIDDTPDCVTLSCFDPVRREIAKIALLKLVSDGRIHPSRIEDVVAKAKTEVEDAMQKDAEQAIYDAAVRTVHPELKKLLGRLKYRYSYGQNVLRHSVEVSQIASMIAGELGANVEVARRGGFLHDIGKALDHEMEGPHAQIGAAFAEKYEKPEVVLTIAKHHDDWFNNSLEGIIVQTADAISGGRPGARGESMDNYIKRLQTLEAIANSFQGVEKSYAVQAGREIRIIVKPEAIDDLAASRLAREVARKVEEGLEYPGQIKVTVVRETRAIEYAQ
ncbi:MAG: ribonuclease Y [Dehalococcoidia bacterium]|nr:ribonuclease Y [Dehalococcoidia bacterium]